MQLTYTEENYLKAIFSIQQTSQRGVSVNEIAERMQTRPATVTDMLRKLSEKELIHYEKYKRVTLADTGEALALQIVRKHRLWEAFLHDKLMFTWDEVHEVAEQLEHIRSQKLIDRLDDFLGYPKFDPHGDPIPNAKGEMPFSSALPMSKAAPGSSFVIVAVKDTSSAFLQQLEKMNLQIGITLSVKEKMPFDNSVLVVLKQGGTELSLSEKVANNILVQGLKK